MVHIKTPEEIEIMREGGRKLAEILRLLTTMVRVGATTSEIDSEAEKRIRSVGGEPAFKGYRAFGISSPFPGTVCTSINDEIVHGLPYPERIIKEGDIVALDIGMKYKGFYTDTAYTVGVERLSPDKKKLIEVAQKALEIGLDFLNENLEGERVTTSDFGAIVQEYVEAAGFNIVKELVGHGVGKSLHEDPSVPNFQPTTKGEVFQQGMVVAIEPMVYTGSPGVQFEKDNWPVRTTHGGAAAHFEHTVAINQGRAQILTQ